MKYYVKINGVSSETIQGLKISELPSISKPLCRSTREEIDGRDGDIITKLGYSAYDKTLKIGLWGNYDINQVIAFFNQEGKITFSNEPDKYYIFTILNRADFINQLEAFRTASITIHCQPFKYMEQPSPEFDRKYVEETGTDLTFNNSVEAPIVIDLKGNTSQYTLSGKNLFDNSSTIWIRNNNSNYTDNDNLNKTRIRIQNPIKLEEGKTYTISGIPNGISLGVVKFYTNNSTTDNTTVQTKTFTVPTGRPNVIFQFNGENFTDSTNTLMQNADIQVELGNQATSYEEYCGGVPSPNPSYPQNVNVVSGDNDIVVCGKNFFNSSLEIGAFDTNGLPESINTRIRSKDFTLVQPNTTYTISWETTKNARLVVIEYATNTSSSQQITRSPSQYASSPYTFTTTSTTNYIKLYIISTGDTSTSVSDISNIMLNTGETASTYEAYTGTTYNIDLPVENLLPVSDITNSSVLTNNGDGTLTFNGRGIGGINYQLTTPIILKANKPYTLSLTQYSSKIAIALRTNATTNVISASSSYETLTPTNDITINYIRVFTDGDTIFDNFTFSIQLEQNNTPNTYTPYGTTPIELNKIGDYQDYFYKEDDKWYLHKGTGKYVLTGTGATFQFANGIYYTNTQIFRKGNGDILSNYFTYGGTCSNTSTAYANGDGKISYNPSYGVYFRNDNLTSKSQWDTWLTTNNPLLYYPLETATNTEITYQPLINQLNSLEDAESYDGTTNINQVSNDLPFIITASVLCGAAKFIVNNIGNTIAKPVMTIEGSGNIGIYLNDIQIFTIALGDEGSITLDIANMEAYKDGILKNRLVVGDYNSFVLQPGNNTISFSGDVVECEIKNYSRWL